MQEIFKDILGYEGLYQISNLGRVKSLHKRKRNNQGIINGGVNKAGYRFVILAKDKVNKSYLVHRLIAIAFIPNPNNYPIINHKDYDITNNSLDNLEWCTYRYNARHGFANKETTSKYTGVNLNRKGGKWFVSIMLEYKQIYIGTFDTEEKASQVYEQAAKLKTVAECEIFAMSFRKRRKPCPVIDKINIALAKYRIQNKGKCLDKVVRSDKGVWLDSEMYSVRERNLYYKSKLKNKGISK